MRNSPKSTTFILIGLVLFLVVPVVTARQNSPIPEKTSVIQIDRRQGLIPSYIYDLDEDRHGRLLLASYGSGILEFNGRSFSSFLPESISDFPVIRRLVSFGNEVVFVNHTGVWQYRKGWDYPKELFSGNSMVYLLKKVSNDLVIISNSEESILLERDKNGDFSIQSQPFPFPLKEVFQVSENCLLGIDLNGKIYPWNLIDPVNESPVDLNRSVEKAFLFNNQLAIYSPGRIDLLDQDYRITKSVSFPANFRFFVFLEDEDKIWMAGPQGLFYYNENGLMEIPTTMELGKIQITEIFKTSDGTVWLGTYQMGLLKLYDQDIQVVRKNEGSLGYITNILSSKHDSDSTIIVTMGSVYLYHTGHLKEIHLPEKPIFPNFEGASVTNEGMVYVGGNNVLYKGRFGQTHFEKIFLEKQLNTHILKIVSLSNKGFLLGTGNGMYLLDSAFKIKRKFVEGGLAPSNISQISYLKDSLILFGNSVDLFIWRNGKISPFSFNQIKGQVVFHSPASETEVWLGNSNGEAVLFDLSTDSIIQAIRTKVGKLVMTTGLGPDKSLLIATELGPQLYLPDGNFVTYDERVQSFEVPFNSFRFFDNGDYLLGTINELFLIKKSFSPKDKTLPFLEILQINGYEMVKENGPDYNQNSILRVKPDQNNFVFKINHVSFQNGNQVKFSFKLNGYSKDWGPWQSSESVQFTNLPHGVYTLSVRIMSLDEQVLEHEFPVKIQVTIPFWETLPGKVIGFILLLIIVFLVYSYLERNNIKRNRKLAKLVDERTAQIAEINQNLEGIVMARTFDLENKNIELSNSIKEKNIYQRNELIISSNTHDIVCFIDSDFKILLISNSVEDFLGLNSIDLQGNEIGSLLRDDNLVYNVMAYIKRTKSDHSPNPGLLVPIIHAVTKEELLVEIVSKKVIVPELKNPSGYVLNLRNVTERESLKAELVSVYKNIYRDFHDELGNKLARIIALVSMAKIQWRERADISTTISKVELTAKHLYRDTRDFIWSLDESNNNLEELSVQIRDFGEQLFDGSAIIFRYFSSNISNLPIKPNRVRDILLIVKELLTNVLKHSEATECKLLIRRNNEFVFFIIKDNGIGLNLSEIEKGRGLKNIRFRAERSGGKLTFKSGAYGTIIGIKISI